MQINSQKKKTGVIAPKRFVQRVKKQNELFRSYMHQVRGRLGFELELLMDSSRVQGCGGVVTRVAGIGVW